LSEKAKGKQRAVDPPDDDHVGQGSVAEPDAPRDILIRFTEGLPDFNIVVGKLDSAGDVKRRIREARPELLNRRLRLIHSGRLLTDVTLVEPWLNSLGQKRADIKDKVAGPVDPVTPAKPATTWFHCSIGQVMAPDDLEKDDHLQTTQIQPIRGFDRLASAGFSQQDIENLRLRFHSHSNSNYLDHNFAGEEDYDEHIRVLEDQWIDSADAESGPASSFPSSSVIQGLLMGFFFPFLPVFFVHEDSAVFWEDGSQQETANILFSPSMKTGLLVGFLANMLFGIWRYLLDSS